MILDSHIFTNPGCDNPVHRAGIFSLMIGGAFADEARSGVLDCGCTYEFVTEDEAMERLGLEHSSRQRGGSSRRRRR